MAYIADAPCHQQNKKNVLDLVIDPKLSFYFFLFLIPTFFYIYLSPLSTGIL